MRIDLNVTPDGEASLDIDGTPTRARPVSWLDGIHQPHPLVWLSRERQSDIEPLGRRRLVGYVPGPDPDIEAAYEDAERRIA